MVVEESGEEERSRVRIGDATDVLSLSERGKKDGEIEKSCFMYYPDTSARSETPKRCEPL